MSCLFWNCRRFENLCTVRELGDFIQTKNLFVVFLAETLANEVRLKEIKRNLNFAHLHFVERINRGGGLALFWRDSIDI